jgi:hypothetical protein
MADMLFERDLGANELVGSAIRTGYVEFAVGAAFLQTTGYRYALAGLIVCAAFVIRLAEHPCGGPEQECTQDQSWQGHEYFCSQNEHLDSSVFTLVYSARMLSRTLLSVRIELRSRHLSDWKRPSHTKANTEPKMKKLFWPLQTGRGKKGAGSLPNLHCQAGKSYTVVFGIDPPPRSAATRRRFGLINNPGRIDGKNSMRASGQSLTCRHTHRCKALLRSEHPLS